MRLGLVEHTKRHRQHVEIRASPVMRAQGSGLRALWGTRGNGFIGDNGKQTGSYHSTLGLYWDSGKENENSYNVLYRDNRKGVEDMDEVKADGLLCLLGRQTSVQARFTPMYHHSTISPKLQGT